MPETIDDAVRALGVDSLRRLLMTVGMDMLRVRHAREFDLLWRHSFATALAAHGLAARARTWTSDRAYLAGLLHDVADMLLLRADRERFLALWADAAGDQTRGLDAERAAYGRDHALLGASILFQWRIDRDVVDVIARHHEADAAPGTHAALLALAEFMASDAGFPFPTPAVRPVAAVFAHYGYDRDEDWTQAVADLQLAVEQEAALLK
jgi:putative nucleotidyltransferase with HDIG domain